MQSRLSLVYHRTPENLVAKRSFALQSLVERGAVMGTVTVVRLGSYLASGLDLGCVGASGRQHLKHL